jgi:hypothetical protein
MSGFGDFFKQLFSNIGKMKDQRQPMVSGGRGDFGVFRPQTPMGNDLPEQGGFSGNLNTGDSAQPSGGMLEMLMKSGQQNNPNGSFPPAGNNQANSDE